MDQKKQDISSLSKEEQLELIFYQFNHNYYRVEQVFKRIKKVDGKFRLKLKMNEKGVEIGYTVPDDQIAMEFTVAMSKFLLPNSFLYIDNLLRILRDLDNNPQFLDFLSNIEKSILKAKEGQIQIRTKNGIVKAEDIYIEISSKVIFANDIDAIAYLENLRKDPIIYNFTLNHYYGYCFDMFNIISSIILFIKGHNISPPRLIQDDLCIYCKSKDGSFTTVEHVVPESIGNETLFLNRGYVCDNCNNKFSVLENIFVNSPPFHLLRIFSNITSKKGRFPAFNFDNVHFQKTSPNTIKMVSHVGDKGLPKEEILPDGTLKLKMPVVKKKLDYHSFARVLFKIGLGLVTIDRGRDEVLQERYDPAREYILNGGHFQNRFVFYTEVELGSPGEIYNFVNDKEGTFIYFVLLGAKFFLNLEPEPKIPVNNEILQKAVIFDLWRDEDGPHHILQKDSSNEKD